LNDDDSANNDTTMEHSLCREICSNSVHDDDDDDVDFDNDIGDYDDHNNKTREPSHSEHHHGDDDYVVFP